MSHFWYNHSILYLNLFYVSVWIWVLASYFILFTLHTFRSHIIFHTPYDKLPERDAFSDEEDSDEEDSEYEEVMIPKKQAKRKRGANEAASSKRVKPNPKPKIRILKKLVPRAMPNKQAPSKRARVSMDMPGPPPGPPPKRFKPNTLKPSSILSRR